MKPTAECPSLRIQQGVNQKCYVRYLIYRRSSALMLFGTRIVADSATSLVIAKPRLVWVVLDLHHAHHPPDVH